MIRFLIGINGDLEKDCWFMTLHDNMDLYRSMVLVQIVEENHKKRGVRDARRPKPQDQEGPSDGGHKNYFGVREQPMFKKGNRVQGTLNFQRSTTHLEEVDRALEGQWR